MWEGCIRSYLECEDMKIVTILEPLWKDKSVSIAKHKALGGCKVKIAYKDKYANKPFPHTYYLSEEKAKASKSVVAGGTPCWNVPISELGILEVK